MSDKQQWYVEICLTDHEDGTYTVKHLEQRFSIHLEARTLSGRKNHFCTPCTI